MQSLHSVEIERGSYSQKGLDVGFLSRYIELELLQVQIQWRLSLHPWCYWTLNWLLARVPGRELDFFNFVEMAQMGLTE